MKKNIINIILGCILIAIIIFIGIEIYKEQKTEKEVDDFFELSNYQAEQTEQKIEEKQYPKAEVEKEYKGYEVCAKIEIPIIELETYILKDYSKKALDVSPTKYWGANPNEIGNFCIVGHNMRTKNMFGSLKKLEIDDKIIVSDNNIGIIEYEIFDIDIVSPDNTDCLLQQTDGKREITLITCTSDSKRRIIIKAREI